MDKLLLFVTSYANPQKDVIAATLAWLAEKAGLKFEVYYEANASATHFTPFVPESHFGSTVVGGSHRERLYQINSLFDVECVIHGAPKLFSSSFLKSIGANVIVESGDLLDFYQKTFSYFNVQLPKEIALVETRIFQGNLVPSSEKVHKNYFRQLIRDLAIKFSLIQTRVPSDLINISPYCYPEIYYRQALGVGYTFPFSFDFDKISDLESVYTLFVHNQNVASIKEQGFNFEVADEFRPDDTYWSMTNRIMARWKSYSGDVTFTDPVLTSYWLPWLCRHKKLAVYEPLMEPVRNEMRDLMLDSEERIIYGRQTRDKDITELSKDDIIFQLIEPGRPAFPIMEEANYNMYRPEKSYYDVEPDDDTLKSFAEERKVLCTFLFYCPDVRHTEVLPRIHELVSLTKIKAGIALTAQMYQMAPDILEMFNIPSENGGAFPNVEPLLCSAGMGVGVEAKGFLKEETLRRHLKTAKQLISKVAGSKLLPKGYYPLLDSIKDFPYSKSVFNRENNLPPPFELLEELGFEYSISYMSPGNPKVLHKTDDFISVNHTSKQLHPYTPFLVMSDLNEIKKFENRLTSRGKPGWIIATLDSPLWLYSYYHWKNGNKLFDMASYVSGGGKTGKLISATPHVVSRYARILKEKGLL